MSLLNLTNDGLPNVLFAIADWLSERSGPVEESELLGLIGAPNAVQESKMVSQTLRKWVELGLFKRNGTLIEPLKFGVKRRQMSQEQFFSALRILVRRCVFSKENNANLWAAEGAKSADLTRTLAWLLTQDVYKTTIGTQLEALENGQILDAELTFMQNHTRRTGLQKWAGFLGFTSKPERGDIDPTIAVREILPLFGQPGQTLKANDFLDALAEELPVLDRGRYRLQVDAKLDGQAKPPLPPNTVSTSLSRTLIRLRVEGEIELESRADATDGWVLSGRNGQRTDLRFTHVTFAKR